MGQPHAPAIGPLPRYNSLMSRQLVFTAAACALAACVLIATLVFSPSIPALPKSDRPILDPTAKFQPGPDPKSTSNKPGTTITPSGVVEKYYVRRYNDAKKQLTILSGEKARPKPNGVVDIEQIIAHIHLIPGRRVLEIKGPRGTLVAPDNNPESGTLTGGVVITLYESPENTLVELGTASPHASLKLFLDETVNFNIELGTVESEGPVHLTTQRVDFQGTGLNLIYNERRRRINRLEIANGDTMRFNPKAGTDFTKTDSKAKKDAKTTANNTDYYRALFESKVQVHTAEAAIDAGRMEILFSLENRSESEAEVKELGALDVDRLRHSPPSQGGPGGGLDPRNALKLDFSSSSFTTRTTQLTTPTENAPASRSMMKPAAEDVVIKWTGSLLMEPLADASAELTGPDDTMITFSERVKIKSAKNETITAERVDYLSSAARVRVYGDTLAPAVIESPRFGRLHVIDLVIAQNEGTGKITGPGAIVATAEAALAPGTQVTADGKPVVIDGETKLPPGLTLAWNEGAELTFHPKAAPAKKPDNTAENARNQNPTLNPTAKLDALKEAIFHGSIKVEHPQFDLLTDRLAIEMKEPAKGQQEPQLIQATGNVAATARGQSGQAPLEIETKDLAITFAPSAKGKAMPRRMLATGEVKTHQAGKRLAAGLLDVTFGEAAKKPDAKDAKDPQPKNAADRMAIERLLAEQDAKITIDSPRTLITASRIEGDSLKGVMQLFGTTEAPARVEREDDSLTGRHITFQEADQFITVSGPGAAEFITQGDAAKPNAPAPPPQRLKINWLHAMDFNNRTGLANFHGQVVAGSDRGVDVSRFQSSDLTLELDPIDPRQKQQDLKGIFAPEAKPKAAPTAAPAPAPAAPPAPAASPAPPAPPAPAASPRMVRKMTATEKVVFEAEQWADRVGGKLGTRFRLTGPLLTFDNVTGKLIVTGAGTMQIEDYRAKGKVDDAKAAAKKADPASPVAFVGQGVTLFLWQSFLSIDANHNDVRMDKDVKMIQQPAGGSEIIMQCNQLIADFQSTGGLNSWLTGKAGEPKIDNVTAAGSLVIMYQKQTIRGDQLYYTSNKQMAIISAEEGKMAELDTEQATLPARQFRWFLDKDRIVAEEPGAVRTKAGK